MLLAVWLLILAQDIWHRGPTRKQQDFGPCSALLPLSCGKVCLLSRCSAIIYYQAFCADSAVYAAPKAYGFALSRILHVFKRNSQQVIGNTNRLNYYILCEIWTGTREQGIENSNTCLSISRRSQTGADA